MSDGDPSNSPKWKRPSDIMKKHRKKKRLSLQPAPLQDNLSNSLSEILSPNNAFNLQTNSKRRNPFSQETNVESPSKRRKSDLIEDENSCCGDKSDQNVLFTILGDIDKARVTLNSI